MKGDLVAFVGSGCYNQMSLAGRPLLVLPQFWRLAVRSQVVQMHLVRILFLARELPCPWVLR